MIRRRAPLVLALLSAGALALSGCGGAPDPVETTPLFASEEEAFAAAEETYRAYVDALNHVDLSDPETFEPVFALTTGEANADDRKGFTQMRADALTASGATRLISFVGTRFDAPEGNPSIRARACVDVSALRLEDKSGASRVSPERPPTYALDVVFSADHSSRDLLIESSAAVEDSSCEL